jgi:hypothetical protein
MPAATAVAYTYGEPGGAGARIKFRSKDRTPLHETADQRVSTEVAPSAVKKLDDALSVNSPCTLAKMTVSPSAPGAAGARKFGIVHESQMNLAESSSGCFVFGRVAIEEITAAGVTCKVLTRFSAQMRQRLSAGCDDASRCHAAVSEPYQGS